MSMDGDLAKVSVNSSMGRLLGFFERHNIFYLLSAFLMLIGCYLISIPLLFQWRDAKMLLLLVGVINLYEVLVVLTCAYILRRAPARREVSSLLLVELLFLLDVTFTMNTVLSRDYNWGLVVLLGSLVLAFSKIYVMERGAGRSIFGRVKAFLYPALIFLYTTQLLVAFRATPGALTRDPQQTAIFLELAAYLPWLLLGGLLFTLFAVRMDDAPQTTESAVPWWETPGFGKTVVVLAIPLLVFQVVSHNWVYAVPFSWSFVVPVVFALGAVLPVFFPQMYSKENAALRAFFPLAMLGITALSRTGALWTMHLWNMEVVFTAARCNVLFAALAFFAMWRREGLAFQFHLACALLAVAVLGHDATGVMRFFEQPTLTGLLWCLPIALFWVARNRAYPEVLCVVTLFLWMGLRALHMQNAEIVVGREMIRYWPLAALLLSFILRDSNRLWRHILVVMVALFGVGSCAQGGWQAEIYFLAVFSVLGVAALFVPRIWRFLLLAYLALGEALLYGVFAKLPLPRTWSDWGAVAIGLAFAVFGLGFWITRRSLEHPDENAVAPEPVADPGAPGS